MQFGSLGFQARRAVYTSCDAASGFFLRDLSQVALKRETVLFTIDPYYGNLN